MKPIIGPSAAVQDIPATTQVELRELLDELGRIAASKLIRMRAMAPLFQLAAAVFERMREDRPAAVHATVQWLTQFQSEPESNITADEIWRVLCSPRVARAVFGMQRTDAARALQGIMQLVDGENN